jgi:methyl-accepting chemotaxis protein
MILRNATLDEAAVGTHLTCRLGKWIQTQDMNKTNAKAIYDRISEPHSKIHECAKKAIQQYNRNDIAGAEDTLKLIDSASRDVINLLKN